MTDERNWQTEDVGAWTLRDLRDEGFAICAFNPDELDGAPASRVEDRMCELGWEIIGDLK